MDPSLVFRATNKAGSTSIIPDATGKAGFEFSAISALTIDVPPGSVGVDKVADYSIIELLMDGEVVDDGRWLVRGRDWKEGETGDVSQFTGRHLMWDRLSKTIVWPSPTQLILKFTDATVGKILRTLFNQATARGSVMQQFNWDFTDSVDSNGTPWSEVIDIEYRAGTPYDDIVSNLVERELVELRLRGNEIQAFVSGGMASDSSALLIVGRDIVEAPQKSSADNVVSDVAVIGDEDVYTTQSNTETRANYGREESAITQGGMNNLDSLGVLATVELSRSDSPRVQRTYGIQGSRESPWSPLRDYAVSQWVRVNHGTETLRFRCRQMVLDVVPGRLLSGSMVLNDKFLESELRLNKKVNGIINGATITGSSRPDGDEEPPDTGVPKAPTGLGFSSVAYLSGDGRYFAQVTAGWNVVNENTNGTPVSQIDYYEAQWRYGAYDWSALPTTSTNSISWSGVEPDTEISVQVRAVSANGNRSVWSPTFTQVTGVDTTPPPVPSTLVASTRLGTITLVWDGLTEAGAAMPADFRHGIVYMASASGASVASSTVVGTLTRSGLLTITNAPFAVNRYFRMVALDTSGNTSGLSAEVVIAALRVEGPDLEANSVNTNSIEAGAVRAVHLAVSSIDADKLSFGITQNIIPDPSFADPDLRAHRLDGKLSWIEYLNGFSPPKWTFAKQGHATNNQTLELSGWVGCKATDRFYLRCTFRQLSPVPNAGAVSNFGLRTRDKDGVEILTSFLSSSVGNGTIEGVVGVPAGAVECQVVVFTTNHTSGWISFLSPEVKPVIGNYTPGGSGLSITPLGVEAFNSSGVRTYFLDAATGDVNSVGIFKTASVNNMFVEMSGWAYDGRPGIKLDVGGSWGLPPIVFASNADYTPPAGTFVYPDGSIVLASAEVTANSSGRGEVQLNPGGYFKVGTAWGPTRVGMSHIPDKPGTLLLYGRIPSMNAMYLDSAIVHHYLTSAGGPYTGLTFTYGATMDSSLRVTATPLGADPLKRFRVTSNTVTSVEVEFDSQSSPGFNLIGMRI